MLAGAPRRRPHRPLPAARPDRQPPASRHPARPRRGRGADAPRSLQRHHRGADHGRRSALDRRARPRRPGRRDCRPRPLFCRARRRPAASSPIRAPRRSAPAGRPARRPGRRRSTSAPTCRSPSPGPAAPAHARSRSTPNLPPDLVRRLAAEAHRQGLRVWAHGMVFPTAPGRRDRRRARRRLAHLLSRLPAARTRRRKAIASASRSIPRRSPAATVRR